MKKYAILTVIYHETKEHFNMALNSWVSMPDVDIYAIINRKLEGVDYPENIIYIQNSENCLSKAWNIGLKKIFQNYEYAFVSGLDSLCPLQYELDKMIIDCSLAGFVSASSNGQTDLIRHVVADIKHGDGSFSFFCISKQCFEDVGDFDERYKPAYFEDNDYLERLWLKKYKPIRCVEIGYMHVQQGTLKFGSDTKKSYPAFMQKNLDLFKSVYGKVPEHLPADIMFCINEE